MPLEPDDLAALNAPLRDDEPRCDESATFALTDAAVMALGVEA